MEMLHSQQVRCHCKRQTKGRARLRGWEELGAEAGQKAGRTLTSSQEEPVERMEVIDTSLIVSVEVRKSLQLILSKEKGDTL